MIVGIFRIGNLELICHLCFDIGHQLLSKTLSLQVPNPAMKNIGANVAETANFKCLRCEHEYEDKYTPNLIQERSCPKCGSNSVRRLPEKKAAPLGN